VIRSLAAFVAAALSYALVGCSLFRAAERDPGAAIDEAKRVADAACAKASLLPAGKAKTDAEAFCRGVKIGESVRVEDDGGAPAAP
jgi:hypothetical protein